MMTRQHSILALAACACIAGAAQAGGPLNQPPAQAAAQQIEPETDRLIVKYKDSAPAEKGAARVPPIAEKNRASLNRAASARGIEMRELHSNATGAHVIGMSKRLKRAEAEALARELMASDPDIVYAEPDLILRKMATPNDPHYSKQWHYYEATGGMRANTAWDKARGTGIVVAVIDTGYLAHADLNANYVPGFDFISSAFIGNDGGGRDSDARDTGDAVYADECGAGYPAENSSWHGTHVAGTIAAATNNGIGVAGVAYGAKILPIRVLGKCGGYTSDIADGIIWASGGTVTGAPANAYRARVLNLSLGGAGACSITTQNAINSARSRGSVVVVAAGNSNINASNSNPANCAGVVTVAATGRYGGKAPYSNYGTVVDLAAPGGDGSGGILSTLNSGTRTPIADNYVYYQGTSMATPHVAGVAALMYSVNTNLTPDEVEARLKSTARAFPATCTTCGTGILDAARAVDAAMPVATGPTLNESEANNTLATFDPVPTSGTVVTGTMLSSTDLDYFMVYIPAGRRLTAVLTMTSTANDYDLHGYNPSGSMIAVSQNGYGQTDTISMYNNLGVTKPFYVRVKFTGGNYGGGTTSSYTLKLTW